MTYNVFTATDYIDALDQLIEVLTSRHLASITLTAGGSGYEANEILDIDNTGATRTHDAQIEVLTVDGGGAILTARVYRGGAYTVDPTDVTAAATATTDLLADGSAVASANGTGGTFDLTFAATGWSQLTRQSEVDTLDSIAAAGTGYSVSDTLTLVGGVLAPGGSAATFNVDTLSGSAVATASIVTRGDYEVFPTDPVLTTVSPAGGTGCTLNLTPRDITGDTIVVLQGDAGAATDPLIGIKAYSTETDETDLNTVYNWALFGMTSWSDQFALHEQANVTPGFNTSLNDGTLTTSDGTGSFVPLKDSDAFDMEVTVRATGRSVTVTARVEGVSTVYSSQCSFGLLNQLGVATEFPFPAYVAGASSRKEVWYRDTASIFGGLSSAIQLTDGPVYAWAPEGAWIELKSAIISGAQDTSPSFAVSNDGDRAQVWPLGPNTPRTGDDQISIAAGGSGFDNEDLTLVTNAVQIYRTPDTGGDLFPLFPVTYAQSFSSGPDYRVFGQIDGVFWLSDNDANLAEGDRIEQGSNAYAVHQNGTQLQPHDFLVVEES